MSGWPKYSCIVAPVGNGSKSSWTFDATPTTDWGNQLSLITYNIPVVTMEYAQQLANIANVQNYANGLRNTRLASLKHPGEFFDWQRVCRFPLSRTRTDEVRYLDLKILQST